MFDWRHIFVMVFCVSAYGLFSFLKIGDAAYNHEILMIAFFSVGYISARVTNAPVIVPVVQTEVNKELPK